jgi:hypothetical protein
MYNFDGRVIMLKKVKGFFKRLRGPRFKKNTIVRAFGVPTEVVGVRFHKYHNTYEYAIKHGERTKWIPESAIVR